MSLEEIGHEKTKNHFAHSHHDYNRTHDFSNSSGNIASASASGTIGDGPRCRIYDECHGFLVWDLGTRHHGTRIARRD